VTGGAIQTMKNYFNADSNSGATTREEKQAMRGRRRRL
jgi:hypothetical protein